MTSDLEFLKLKFITLQLLCYSMYSWAWSLWRETMGCSPKARVRVECFRSNQNFWFGFFNKITGEEIAIATTLSRANCQRRQTVSHCNFGWCLFLKSESGFLIFFLFLWVRLFQFAADSRLFSSSTWNYSIFLDETFFVFLSKLILAIFAQGSGRILFF